MLLHTIYLSANSLSKPNTNRLRAQQPLTIVTQYSPNSDFALIEIASLPALESMCRADNKSAEWSEDHRGIPALVRVSKSCLDMNEALCARYSVAAWWSLRAVAESYAARAYCQRCRGERVETRLQMRRCGACANYPVYRTTSRVMSSSRLAANCLTAEMR